MWFPDIACTEDAERREQEFAEFYASFHPPTMILEYEECWEKVLIIAKKRYVKLVKGRLKYKGVEAVRRDQIGFLQDLFPLVMERLFADPQDVAGARRLIREHGRELLEGRVPLHKLVLSARLSRLSYKSSTLSHVTVRDKMVARGQRAPQLGERIPYLYVEGAPGTRAYQRAESPDWALERGLRIDYAHYLEAKVKKPLERLMMHFFEWDPRQAPKRQRTGLWGREAADPALAEDRRRRECNAALRRWLWHGLSTHRQQNRATDGRGILAWARPQLLCECCRAAYSFELVCGACRAATEPVVAALERWTLEARQAVDTLEACMARCRSCLGCETDAEVLCDNASCPDYYPRRLAQIDDARTRERQRVVRELLNW